jgi:lysozyme
MTVRVSEYGAKFICGFEGFRSCPYGPPRDVWTIGYGSTEGVTGHTPCVTRAQALERMIRHINSTYAPAVADAIQKYHLRLNQNQIDALISIVYNCGPGILASSRSLGAALKRGAHSSDVAKAFMLYTMPGSIFHAGLLRRRKAEVVLWNTKPVDPRLAKWRKELRKRRVQLKVERNAGTIHFLRRRIHDLVTAIQKNR